MITTNYSRPYLTYDDVTDSVACFTSTNMPHELHV